MSYLFVVVIGTVAGWLFGMFIQKSEMPVAIDLAAGALGAIILVVLSRMVGPAGASGFVMSTIVTIIGAVASVFIARRVMKEKTVPVTRRRRT